MGWVDRLVGREDEGTYGDIADVIPLPQQAESQPFGSPRPLLGSAERLNLKKNSGKNALLDRPFKEWQRDAWAYYDAIGEIKYAFTLLAAVFSRLRIYAALNLDPDAPPQSTTQIKRRTFDQTDEETRQDEGRELKAPSDVTKEVMDYMEQLIEDLGSGSGGIAGLLRTFALNMSVSGEVYLCNIDQKWSCRSTEEVIIRETDSKPVLRTMRTGGTSMTGSPRDKPLPEKTYIGRIWKPHPRYSGEPDSSMLGLLEMCDELLTLQKMIRAIARSKMNAGMIFVPDSITAASQSVVETTEDEELEADPFEQEFMQAILSSQDESSASTVAPMVARGPGEDGDKIKYIKFDREADKQLVERCDRALERVLQGIDVPKDIVTGLANVKYSNAVQIDEGLYKSHVEPLALLFVDSITAIFLRPALKAKFPDLGETTLRKLVVWYDPTEVVTKPDPAHAAEKLYDAKEITGDAFRRAFGFPDTDKPGEDEIARRMAMDFASPPPELIAALIKHLLPTVFAEAQAASPGAQQMPESAKELLEGGDGQPPYGQTDSTPPEPELVQGTEPGVYGETELEQ